MVLNDGEGIWEACSGVDSCFGYFLTDVEHDGCNERMMPVLNAPNSWRNQFYGDFSCLDIARSV